MRIVSFIGKTYRMKKVFFIKVKSTKEVKDVVKNVTELVMLKAISLTDIDKQVQKYAETYPQFRGMGVVEIVGVTFTKVVDIFEASEETLADTQWYKVQASHMEEISEGKMMKRTDTFMIESTSVKKAESEVTEHLRNYMEDYSIAGVATSKVLLYMNEDKPMKQKTKVVAESDEEDQGLFSTSAESES